MNRHIKSFLQEFVSRFRKENPTFFKYIQALFALIGAITSGIEIISQSFPTLLPAWIQAIGSLNGAIVSIIAIIVAQLPNKS